MFEKKYKVVFLRKQFEAIFVERILQLDNIQQIVSLGNKKYEVKIGNLTYIVKNQKVYFMDYDTGSQFSFVENKKQLAPEELDLIVGQKIIRELTSGVLDNQKEKFFLIVLGAILGALLMGLILMYYYTTKIQELFIENPEEPDIIINSAKGIRGLIKYV
jgi:hypothetical protein